MMENKMVLNFIQMSTFKLKILNVLRHNSMILKHCNHQDDNGDYIIESLYIEKE